MKIFGAADFFSYCSRLSLSTLYVVVCVTVCIKINVRPGGAHEEASNSTLFKVEREAKAKGEEKLRGKWQHNVQLD